MRLVDIYASIVAKLVANPKPPDRPMSTPEDVIWHRRQLEEIQREAMMAGIDIDLERAGRQ